MLADLAGFHINCPKTAETEGEGCADEFDGLLKISAGFTVDSTPARSEDFSPSKGLVPRGHRTKVDVTFDPKEPRQMMLRDVARTCDAAGLISILYTSLYQDKGQKSTEFLIYKKQQNL